MSENYEIKDLRSILFETLTEVKAGRMKLDTAKTICDISQGIINSAKVEVEFIKAVGGNKGTGFIGISQKNDA